MNKLTGAVKKIVDGLAFKHAGEGMSVQQKAQALEQGLSTIDSHVSVKVYAPPKALVSENARRVAFFMGSALPSEIMDYVIQACSHLKYELTVLTFQSKNAAKALLDPYQEAMEQAAVKMELVTLSGDPMPGLSRYLRNRPKFAFLACKDSGYLARRYIKGMQGKHALPVPVVVISANSKLASTQGQLESTVGDSDNAVV